MSSKIKILPNINPKDYFPDVKHIITYAFSIDNRHYFRFDDPINTPYDRALKCLVYFKELDMNTDRAFLEAHTKAFDNALSGKEINIDTLISLKKLNDQLKQRLSLPKEPDLMYKLASVVFFDQFENPAVYEFKYGEKKIRAWKKNVNMADFFLQRPLLELIPYLQYAKENLEQFSRMTQKATQEHLDSLLEMLSEEQKTILLDKLNLSPAL
ncbi:hypothetical protein JMG10_07625 [Nostoc ellipsosporum NOK]|nr:hypothetical protein [Nostoc ellipsosporum NOK]